MNFKPLGRRVLIKQTEAEQVTKAGIYIPDAAQEKPREGTVIAIGSGTKDEPMTVSIGDTVLFGKYGHQEIEFKGEKYLLAHEPDILAIIKQ